MAGVSRAFAKYVGSLKGDEKGEAQVFCDRLFQAFGHGGYKEAGASLEFRVKKSGTGTKFADLVWPGKALIEMKSRGADLRLAYQQAFDYWIRLVPHRPQYVILCNFDQIWIYDFNLQMDAPVDEVPVDQLPERFAALNFMFPGKPKPPIFGNNKVAVSRDAANWVATIFNQMVARGIDRDEAQRFVLQLIVALFAQGCALIPQGFVTELVVDCQKGESSFDLFGDLFRWMNTPMGAKGGRFKAIPYFNGGLFANVSPVEMDETELDLLEKAAKENWAKVHPAIFGTLLQDSMGEAERHAQGAHFTSEADIQRIVGPTIVRPFRERIEAAKRLEDLRKIRSEIASFRVLDPACGSGNFLYVAYRELARLELMVLTKMRSDFRSTTGAKAKDKAGSFVSIKQFYGIDTSPFAVELAKVTLLLGKKLVFDELQDEYRQGGLALEHPLPLDNLDNHILCDDALLMGAWPEVDAIIGNPPFQSKNKMQAELGASYVNKVRRQFPGVPGRADYCVYWFRRAHDELRAGHRAGLVGTNTIRENYSRQGGLDHIVENGGTITDAISTQVWSGAAAVHVSIVNWIKGDHEGRKTLSCQEGDRLDSPWTVLHPGHIHAALSSKADVTQAKALEANREPKVTFQGQTHGHEGFLVTPDEAAGFISKSSRNAEVLHPFLGGLDILTRHDASPSRYVIDFHPSELTRASIFREPFERVQRLVLKHRETEALQEAGRAEELRTSDPNARPNKHHANFLNAWWFLSWPRPDMKDAIGRLTRYVACARVTKRPIFVFVEASIRPQDALQVFALEDDYSFGILQSDVHWEWFTARCSTLTRRFRYTSETVFDAFPWPQSPTRAQVRAVAECAVEVRRQRIAGLEAVGSLRKLYRLVELPGKSPLKSAHRELDLAVRAAYGIPADGSSLSDLLDLNLELATSEGTMVPGVGPGVPPGYGDPSDLVTTDCIQVAGMVGPDPKPTLTTRSSARLKGNVK